MTAVWFQLPAGFNETDHDTRARRTTAAQDDCLFGAGAEMPDPLCCIYANDRISIGPMQGAVTTSNCWL